LRQTDAWLEGHDHRDSVPSVICTGIALSGREIFESLPHRQNPS